MHVCVYVEKRDGGREGVVEVDVYGRGEEVRARAGESEDERGRKGRQGGWEIPKRQTY